MGRIVVGIDDSTGAQHALEWAAREAAAHGATLEVVYVYEHDPSWMAYAFDEGMSAAQVEAVRERMREEAEEAHKHAHDVVDRMLAAAEIGDGVSTEAVVLEGRRPAARLVELSAGADLLVVGSRGRGGFSGLLLGSVSQQCVTHAECPVAVVREPAGAVPQSSSEPPLT